MASFMSSISEAPPNVIFHLNTLFKEDKDAKKMNLGVGAYRDENGQPWVLPVVKRVEAIIEQKLESGQINKEYLPIAGLPEFVTASAKLALGDDHPAIKEGRVDGVQCVSGTGALRVACEFLGEHAPNKNVYVSNPTWENHGKIFQKSGLVPHDYRYYNPATCGLDFDGMMADIGNMPSGAIILLHACAHNPTGVDPTPEQWIDIAKAVQARNLFVLFDSAYQGFASGDPARDSVAMRHFADVGIPFIVCQSYSKNFGLYNERIGCMTIVAESAQAARAARSQVELVVRPNYSNPPVHGALIVATVLNTPELRAEWMDNIKTMSSRIFRMRQLLFDGLKARGCPGTWTHITQHIGMFTFTGLSPDQVKLLTSKYHIYLLANGRINMCGVTEHNVNHLADAITDAVTSVPVAGKL